MSKVHSYIINKDGEKYIRLVAGELVDAMGLDYQNATLKELQITASFALHHMYDTHSEVGKKLKKYGINNLMIYHGGHHIKLVKNGETKDLSLFYVLEAHLSAYSTSDKDILLNMTSLY